MTLFESVLETYHISDQIKINAKLDEWSTEFPYGQRISRNIVREHSLPLESMKKLFDVILACEATDIETLEREYEQECYKNTLKGSEVAFPKRPQHFGCAVER
ncbi:MAG: hypothetical protein AAF789_12915, partial [Bacteroidota bacterium]